MFNNVNSLLSRLILHSVHNLLDNLFDLYNNRLFDYFFYYLLNNPINLFNALLNLFDNYSFLMNHFYLSDFGHLMVNNSLDSHWFIDIYNFLFNHLHLHNLRNFDPFFNYFLDNFWNFHHPLLYLLDFHDFFYYSIYILDNFNWHMNHFFYLFILNSCAGLLNDSFNRHNCWHFDYSFHNLLYDLRDFHNFLVNLKLLKNVFNFRGPVELLFDHINHCLFHLRILTCPFFHTF